MENCGDLCCRLEFLKENHLEAFGETAAKVNQSILAILEMPQYYGMITKRSSSNETKPAKN